MKMIKLVTAAILFAVLSSSSLQAGHILLNWTIANQRSADILGWYVNKGSEFKATKTFDATTPYPGGTGCLKIKIEQTGKRKSASGVQLAFLYNKGIIEGKKYRITAWYMTDAKATFQFSAIMNGKPWSPLAEKSTNKIDTEGKKWEKAELDFVAAYDYDKGIRVPYFALGSMAPGTTIWINNITFEELNEKKDVE